MRKALFITVIVSLAFFLISCGSTEPGPVQAIGAPEDLLSLTGEWTGTYDGAATGRGGSITFHLTENPLGAHGDVLMVPKQEHLYNLPLHDARDQSPHGMLSSSSILSIEFVRIASGEISGKMTPYSDPELSGATLETHFTGHLDGDWIEGTFVTYSDHGSSPRRGTWRVHRKSAR
jgi:hypothetical protein